jgi:hypothetical protein
MARWSFGVAALVVSVATATVATATFDTVQVQVMHRHGARAAIVADNMTLVCGEAKYCGELNEAGRNMLVNVGAWIRNQFGTALGLPAAYSQYHSYSRSTDLDRTMQSAVGLLHGLYPDNASFFPVVNTVFFDTDELLLIDAQMSYHIPVAINDAPAFALPASFFELFTPAELNAMGRETYQHALCSLPAFDQAAYQQCVFRVQDIAASWNAEGRLSATATPTVLAKYANLSVARRDYNTQLYIYDASNEDQRNRGSTGYNLASRIVNQMYAAAGLLGAAAVPYQTLMEWSAHDTTYMPLASAIGFNTPEYMLPLFGEAFVMELSRDSTAANPNASNFYVRIWGGHPSQSPGPHDVDMQELTVNGLDAQNKPVAGSGATPVSLDDFARLVNSTAPQSPAGDCYLSKKVIKKIHCDTIHVPDDANCILWRQRCPRFSCPDNYALNPADLSCVSEEPHQLVTTAAAVLMVVVAAVAGAIIGATAFGFSAHCSKKQPATEYGGLE